MSSEDTTKPASSEEQKGILDKTKEVLHKAADATVFSTYGNQVDGTPRVDGAIVKDVLLDPHGNQVDGTPRLDGAIAKDMVNPLGKK